MLTIKVAASLPHVRIYTMASTSIGVLPRRLLQQRAALHLFDRLEEFVTLREFRGREWGTLRHADPRLFEEQHVHEDCHNAAASVSLAAADGCRLLAADG